MVLLGVVFAPVLTGHSASATPTSDNDYAYFNNQGLAFGQQSVMKYAITAASSDFTFARTTPFTLEAMVKPRSFAPDKEGNVFDFRDNPGHNAEVRFVVKSQDGGNTGSVAIWNPPRGDVASPTGINNFNQWNHIAAVYDGNDGVKLYVNGVLNGSSTNWYPDTQTNVRLYLGFDSDRFYDGWMNEVRVWKGVARTQSQILANMGNEIDPASTGLVAYYRMDDRGGTSFLDETGRGNTAVFTNAITFATGANGVTNSEVPTTTTTTIATTTTSTTTTTTIATTTTSTTTTTSAPALSIVIQAPVTTVAQGQASVATIAPSSTGAGRGVTTTVAAGLSSVTSTTVARSVTTTTVGPPDIAKVSAGESSVLLDGVETNTSVARQNNAMVVTAGSMSATLSGINDQGKTVPLNSDGSVRLSAGDSIKVAVGGFKPDSEVEVWLFSTPVRLGSAAVGSDGSMSKTFILPAGLKSGNHRVAVLAKLPNGKTATFTLGIVVGEISTTSTLTRVLIAIPIALAIGFGLILPTRLRRRRNAKASLS